MLAALEGLGGDAELVQQPAVGEEAAEDADRAGDGAGLGVDARAVGRDPVAAGSGHVAHRDDHGLAREAQQIDLAADLVGSRRVAAGAVHANDHGLDAIVAANLAQRAGDGGRAGGLAVDQIAAALAAGDRAVDGDDGQDVGRAPGAGLVLMQGVGVGRALLEHAGDLVGVGHLVDEVGFFGRGRGEKPLVHERHDLLGGEPARLGDALDDLGELGVEELLGLFLGRAREFLAGVGLGGGLVLAHRDELRLDAELVEGALHEGGRVGQALHVQAARGVLDDLVAGRRQVVLADAGARDVGDGGLARRLEVRDGVPQLLEPAQARGDAAHVEHQAGDLGIELGLLDALGQMQHAGVVLLAQVEGVERQIEQIAFEAHVGHALEAQIQVAAIGQVAGGDVEGVTGAHAAVGHAREAAHGELAELEAQAHAVVELVVDHAAGHDAGDHLALDAEHRGDGGQRVALLPEAVQRDGQAVGAGAEGHAAAVEPGQLDAGADRGARDVVHLEAGREPSVGPVQHGQGEVGAIAALAVQELQVRERAAEREGVVEVDGAAEGEVVQEAALGRVELPPGRADAAAGQEQIGLLAAVDRAAQKELRAALEGQGRGVHGEGGGVFDGRHGGQIAQFLGREHGVEGGFGRRRRDGGQRGHGDGEGERPRVLLHSWSTSGAASASIRFTPRYITRVRAERIEASRPLGRTSGWPPV
ncbi:hypothetical protein D3C72_596530 [compost metagenome]